MLSPPSRLWAGVAPRPLPCAFPPPRQHNHLSERHGAGQRGWLLCHPQTFLVCVPTWPRTCGQPAQTESSSCETSGCSVGSNWGVNSRPGGALAPMSGGLCWQGHESRIFGAVSAGAGVLSRLTRPQCRLHLHQGACWALASTSTARRAPRAPCPSQLLPTPLLNRLR